MTTTSAIAPSQLSSFAPANGSHPRRIDPRPLRSRGRRIGRRQLAEQTAGARRILFLDHTAALGGGEIALLNLVRYLDRDRYEPIVILFSDGPLRQRIEQAGVEVHVLPLSPRVIGARKDSLGAGTLLQAMNVSEALAYCWRLTGLLRRLRGDLVHTNSLKADILGGLAARLAGIPLLWHVRDRIADDYLPSRVAGIFRLLARFLPQVVVANSAATLETLQLSSDRPGTAIPSGVLTHASESTDTNRHRIVHDGTEEPDARIPRGPHAAGAGVIGLVGRITRWKGQHVFLRAAALVRQEFPSARFQVIGAALFGEEEYDKELQTLTRELDLGSCVEFTGFRTDIPDVIAELDVLVHASISGEPFGQVVIEAMAAGKPVVATNGGGIPEIVLDGQTGHLVPMSDAAAMAEAICRLLRDPVQARAMGACGRQRVLGQFTIHHTAEKMQRVYDAMLIGLRRTPSGPEI